MSVPRATSPLLRTVSVAGSLALVVGVSASGGHAAPGDPPPRTSAQAMTELRTVSGQLEQVSKQYVDAQRLLGRRTAQARDAAAKSEAAAAAVAGFRGRIKEVVTSEARSDPFGAFGAMLSSDSPGDFAAQASLIDVVTSRRSVVLTEATRANAAAVTAAEEARTAADAAAKLTRDLAAKRTSLTQQAARSRTLYDRLSAAERLAFLASAGERDDTAATDDGGAATDSTERGNRSGPGTDPMPPPVSVPASGRAGVAVATARAQVGKPYVWGATGPGSFDCSGLTSYAWRAAGVELPRTSRDQYAAGVKVSRSALQPGDLVYFGSPIYHVAVYVGDGQMISAPEPGQLVKYQPMSAFPDYTGATRPG